MRWASISQVLRRLIADAALDQRARALGLAISDETIAAAARSDPNLQDASGQFSRAMFDQALRDSGLSERGFFAQQRKNYLRQQLEFALVDGIDAPKPLVEALAGAEAQTRAIDYFVLPSSAAGDIPAPSPDTLKAYYDDRKSSWRAPEYRAIDILLVSPVEPRQAGARSATRTPRRPTRKRRTRASPAPKSASCNRSSFPPRRRRRRRRRRSRPARASTISPRRAI